ncbi:hypothetical protein [Halanaerobium congolense]|jgi:hypothetical protein|uniref:Uncharacterized protein n=1 Tax=Halanaerobium congolense TaxID=54121 RepID=A0A4R7DX50_9FIRM|nr:hypothetical protein [Halanaerobium congolense]TDS25805.1 hypothetical protein BY453_14512 [Halanaerobium congolense]
MNNLYPFVLEVFSNLNEKILIVGISTKKNNELYFNMLKNRFKNWKLKESAKNESFLIDYFLSKELTKKTPKNIIALGASFKTELKEGCSGGVIGDPHEESRSISESTEKLDNGLILKGLPGGPGIVLSGTFKEAEAIISSALTFDKSNSIKMMKKISQVARELEISHLIAVNDGSGYTDGVVLSLSPNEINIVSF